MHCGRVVLVGATVGRSADDPQAIDLARRPQDDDLGEPFAFERTDPFVESLAQSCQVPPDDRNVNLSARAVGSSGVLVNDRCRRKVQHDRDCRHAGRRRPGQEAASRKAFHVGRVDDGQPTPGEA